MNDEEYFKKRIIALHELAGEYLLKFVDLEHAKTINELVGKTRFLYFSGGYEKAEYQRVIISSEEIAEPNFSITLFKIKYNHQYARMTHRSVLGSLLGLGLKRELIGDIVISGDEAYFACCDEISDFLQNEFHQVGKITVSLEKIINFPSIVHNDYYSKQVFVASLRLDGIISSAYGLSRSDSAQAIGLLLVEVNHVKATKNDLVLKEGDLISYRGKGRVRISKINNLTRKNRVNVTLEITK